MHTQNARTIFTHTRHAHISRAYVFSFFIHGHYFSLCVLVWLNKRLLFSNWNKCLFFCQNVHMPWVSDRSKFIHAPVDEIHCNLDSILASWLRITHPCSPRVNMLNKSQQLLTISFREENWKPHSGGSNLSKFSLHRCLKLPNNSEVLKCHGICTFRLTEPRCLDNG